jgi:elongator complex protein 3
MREFGVTRVELGVQIIDDKIYKIVKRGHTVKDVVDATRELKNAGFKVGYHIMPGLPGSNPRKDLRLFKKLFSDERFKPDQLKIYPCQVMPGSQLEKDFWEGKYKPYSLEKIKSLIIKMIKVVPRYCRIMRVMREIPPEYLVAGTTRIDLRKEIELYFRKKNSKLKEIRYREIGFVKDTDSNLRLKITKYPASKGKEFFLEIVNDDDILFGLLRLRIVGKIAFIREVHVYGQSLKLGEKGKNSQHIGLGKWLIKEAEKICLEKNVDKIFVISGIGVRKYYNELNYVLENTYMSKELKL